MPPCLSALLSHPRVRRCPETPGPRGTGSPRCPGPSIAPSFSSPHLLTLDRAEQPQEPLLCNDSQRRGALGAPSPGNSPQEMLGGTPEGTGGHGRGLLPTGDVIFRLFVPPRGAEWDSSRGSRCPGRLRPLPARPPFTRAAPPPFAPIRSPEGRGDPGPGSAAPRDKEPPGGAAEGESERRP